MYMLYSTFDCSFRVFELSRLDVIFALFVNAQSLEGF